MKKRNAHPDRGGRPPGRRVGLLLLALLLGLAGGSAFLALRHEARRLRSLGGSASPSQGPVVVAPGSRPDLTGLPDPYPQAHALPSWQREHGRSDTRVCAVCHPNATCVGCHGLELPHPAYWREAHGRAALASPGVCSRCHDSRRNCEYCHGLAMPHPGGWVRTHGLAARGGGSTCSRCHTKGECSRCHEMASASSCRSCHRVEAEAVARAGGHSEGECLVCHPDSPSSLGPGKGHRLVPSCLSCHAAAKLAPGVGVVSQRDWLSREGEGLGKWRERGAHSPPDLFRCFWCHDVHDAAVPRYPPGVDPSSQNCAPTCHSWVDGRVVSRGFTNASGDPEQTTYRGTIRPQELLASGSTKHTTEVYARYGCAGLCHRGPHGSITPCTSCHSFKGTENLHGTHVPFIRAEQPAADPANHDPSDPETGCKYCHPTARAGAVYRPSCWNCHLSGHNPITPYWEIPQ